MIKLPQGFCYKSCLLRNMCTGLESFLFSLLSFWSHLNKLFLCSRYFSLCHKLGIYNRLYFCTPGLLRRSSFFGFRKQEVTTITQTTINWQQYEDVHHLSRGDTVKVSSKTGKMYRPSCNCVICKLTHCHWQTVFSCDTYVMYLYVETDSETFYQQNLRNIVSLFGIIKFGHVSKHVGAKKLMICCHLRNTNYK